MASIEPTPEVQARRLLLFGVAGRLCACDLDAVREIVPGRAATRLPGAPEWVSGIVNLRGTLVTVVNLATRFGAGARAAGTRSIVVVETSGKAFGIEVDEVRDVQAVGDDALEAVDVQRSAGGIVRGVAHVGVGRSDTALVCDIAAIAAEALVLGG
ncbi:MAG: chemotaxis protein CheW [Gemmatimonadales bacterium]